MLIYIIMPRPFFSPSDRFARFNQQSDSENVSSTRIGARYAEANPTVNLETVAVKSLFSNGNAVQALSDSGRFNLGHTGTPNTRYSSTSVETSDVQFTVSDDVQGNSVATVASYVPTDLDASYSTTSTDDVTVRSDLSVQKTSFVDASSSAYMDATVKIKFVDQYLHVENYFQDSSDTWEASFDISSNYVPTRNVNSQTAHTDSSVGVSVKDFESWNTQDNLGPFYVEGDVSIDSYGMPILTPFVDQSKNLSTYTDYSVELAEGTPTPVFGRYAARVITANVYKVKSFDTLLTSSDTVTSNLYSALTSDIDPSFNNLLVESNIPVVVGSNDTANPLSDYVPAGVTLQPGFDLHITSSVHDSAIDLINNSLANPFSIDTTNMYFDPVNMYALQNAVGEGNVLDNYEYTDNYVEIINGSLDLSGGNASNGSLTLGTNAEYLTDGQSDNGYVTFPSVNVISGLSGENTYPRASKTLSSDSLHFNQLVVRYEASDDSHTEVGVIGTSLKTATDVSYSIETVVTNTSSSNTDYSNLPGYIGLSNESIALVTQTNATITPSAITYNNTNTVYPEPLYIIDFVCQRNWMQNNLYNAIGDVALSGATFSASGTNTSTSTPTFRDLRIQLSAKTVGNLTSMSGWSLSCDDSYLSSSNEFESCLQSSDIQDLLGGANLGSLAITYGPAEATSIPASKLVQFNDKLTFTYNGHSSVTYNDEFIVTTTSSTDSSATISQSAYTGIPSGCVLNKKVLTTAFTVKTPFRLGAYTNLKITTPTIVKTITYYTLTQDGVELPRRLLAGIIETGVGEITSTVNSYSVTTNYALTADDLKPYSITLQTTLNGSTWTDASTQISADMWYGTQTTINSSIGSFVFNFSMPLTIYSLNVATIYGDLSLEKGTNTFTAAGKSFSFSNILDNSMNAFDFTSDPIPTSYGTVLSLDSPTYNITSLGNNAPGTATLSSSGYSFTYSNNLLLNLRVVVAKQTLFAVVKTVDGSVSNYIKTISNGVLPVDTGIYTEGDLTNTHLGDYSTWSLNNDYASVKLYNGYTMSTSEIELDQTVNGAYLDASNTILISRGVTFEWNRGYNVGTTDIVRTATRVVFDIAGYSLGAYSTDNYVYYGQVRNPFGGLQTTDQLSMYPASVTEDQYWDLELSSYGTYDISYKNNGDPSSNYTVPAYNFIIWQGVDKCFVNNTLNTISFDYRMTYDPVEVDFYRIEDYTSTSTTISDYEYVETYNENELKDSTRDNIIGNVLNIHVGANAALVDILVFFSICPPFISFNAIDPSTISNIPFTPLVENYKTYYSAVDTTSNTYNPFSSSSNINDITFNDTRGLSYLDFFRGSLLGTLFIENAIYSASDIVSYDGTNYICVATTGSGSWIYQLNDTSLFKPWSPLISTPPQWNSSIQYNLGDYASYNGNYYMMKGNGEAPNRNPTSFPNMWLLWPQELNAQAMNEPTYGMVPVITYDMIIDNYNFIVQMKEGLYDVSSNYTTYYDGLIQATTDNSSYLFGPLDASGNFRVELNQISIIPGSTELANNVDPSYNYDLYNLKMTIGSAFIDDETEIYLEFVAGEAVIYETYYVEEQTVSSGSMGVKITKSTTNSGLAQAHIGRLFYKGATLGYSSQQEFTFTKQIPAELPTTPLNRDDFIKSIVANIPDSYQIPWTPKQNVTPGYTLKAEPRTLSSLLKIIGLFAVSKNIVQSLTVFDFPDALLVEDKNGNPISRVKYGGGFVAESLALTAGNTFLPFK